MDYLTILKEKISGIGFNKEKLEEVKKYVDLITDSSLAQKEDIIEGLQTFTFNDYVFSVVKYVATNPDGNELIERSICLKDGTEVYDGRNAILSYLWFNHLICIGNIAEVDINKGYSRTRKKDN